MIEHKITKLVEQFIEETEGFEDCFLLEVKLHDHKKLDVFVDSDTGISFDNCRRISRYLESFIDEEGWLGEKYVLEVSSPGIGRPLKLARQYPRNIGRKMEVKTTEGEKHKGTLVAATEAHIVLEDKVRIKEGKKKRTETVQTEIPYENIREAKVKISFN